MKNKLSRKNSGNILGIISLLISMVVVLLVLNCFLKIVPYESLNSILLLVTFCIIPIGFSIGFTSIKVSYNKFGKWGTIINGIVFLPLFLYFLISIFTLFVHTIV